jgi:hypothetical protein
LSIAAVAKEAGIHPSTIINRHTDLADIIRSKSGINKKPIGADSQELKLLRSQLTAAKEEVETLKTDLAAAVSKQAADIMSKAKLI